MQPNLKKRVIFDEEATAKLLEGAEIVYRAVSATLGPKSHLVAIEHPFGNPTTVGDGVSVAKAIDGLEDNFANVGAKLTIAAAEATNNQVGDGTTTATILTYWIAKLAHEAIEKGANAMVLRKGITAAVEAINSYLDDIKVELKPGQIKQVATISAQNEMLGSIIAEAYERLGKDAVVTVEESGLTSSSIEFKEGMEFDKGILSPYFVTSPETGEATIIKPKILVTDKKLDNQADLIAFLEKFVGTYTDPLDRNLAIICNGLEPVCLATLAAQKIKGVMNVVAIQAPSVAERQVEVLEDIALSVGARFVSQATGDRLKSVEMVDLGSADHITATKKATVIIDGEGIEEDLQARIKYLTDLKDQADTNSFEAEKITERLAKLTSGIAIISIGGNNEAERSELRERAIDAVEATKAALKHGVVAGGETPLLRASESVSKTLAVTKNKDFDAGVLLLLKATQEPFLKLLSNSQIVEVSDFSSILKDTTSGVDVFSGEVTDLFEAGVLDPVAVPQAALRNAASAAMQILATNTIIGLVPTNEQEQPTE